jgi:5-methylcytosine-specific restriction protein A
VVGLGHVTGGVRDRIGAPGDAAWTETGGDEYWLDPSPAVGSHGLPIHVDEFFLDAPIEREVLASDPVFGQATIFRAPQSTNPFRLTEDQWESLQRLIERDIGYWGVSDESFAEEGMTSYRLTVTRERNTELRRLKIAQARKSSGGHLRCEVCDLEPEALYGGDGDSLVDLHHVLPLSVSGPTRTRLDDLAVLCPSCHRAIHASQEWTTPEQLRERVLARSEQVERTTTDTR